MRRGRIQPFDANFVIFLQEVIVDPGKTQAEKADIHMAAWKQATDWRGAAIAHNSAVTQPDETLAMRSVLYAAVGGTAFYWALRAPPTPCHDCRDRCHLGFLVCAVGWLLSRAARLGRQRDLRAPRRQQDTHFTDCSGGTHPQLARSPEQQLDKPAHFPYNTRMLPRRLDYIHTKNLVTPGGTVLCQRDLASSDHEPINISMQTVPRQTSIGATTSPSTSVTSSTSRAGETVDKRIGEILRRLEYACKIHAWRPFTEDELRALRKRWKNGKSCGTDQISHEALKALEFKMGPKLLALFNDLLYTCRIPEAIERGITVFWQKQRS